MCQLTQIEYRYFCCILYNEIGQNREEKWCFIRGRTSTLKTLSTMEEINVMALIQFGCTVAEAKGQVESDIRWIDLNLVSHKNSSCKWCFTVQCFQECNTSLKWCLYLQPHDKLVVFYTFKCHLLHESRCVTVFAQKELLHDCWHVFKDRLDRTVYKVKVVG